MVKHHSVVNPVQLTTTRVILILPRKWSGLGQYQYQTFCCTLLKVHKVILQQKQLVEWRRHGILTLVLSPPNIAGNPKRELGGEAIATHGVMVTMLTVAQCLSLVQSMQNTSANAK